MAPAAKLGPLETTLNYGYSLIDPYVVKARKSIPLIDKKIDQKITKPYVEPTIKQVRQVRSASLKKYEAGLEKVKQVKDFKDAKVTQIKDFKEAKVTQVKGFKDRTMTTITDFIVAIITPVLLIVAPVLEKLEQLLDRLLPSTVEMMGRVISSSSTENDSPFIRIKRSLLSIPFRPLFYVTQTYLFTKTIDTAYFCAEKLIGEEMAATLEDKIESYIPATLRSSTKSTDGSPGTLRKMAQAGLSKMGSYMPGVLPAGKAESGPGPKAQRRNRTPPKSPRSPQTRGRDQSR